jgi:hypothetical protein
MINISYSHRSSAPGVYLPQCLTAAKAGAHIVMIPYGDYLQMVNHLLTDIGLPCSQWLERVFQL